MRRSHFENFAKLEDLKFEESGSIRGFVSQLESDYLRQFDTLDYKNHRYRYLKMLSKIPHSPNTKARMLEVGESKVVFPAATKLLGWESFDLTAYSSSPQPVSAVKSHFSSQRDLTVHYFDLEAHIAPIENYSYDYVLCSEVIEHLRLDPAFMICEINRWLRFGGLLMLTTPNIASLTSLKKLFQHYPPYLYGKYHIDGDPTARHQHEYSIREISLGMKEMGFEELYLSAEYCYERPDQEFLDKLKQIDVSPHGRGDTIFYIGRKVSSLVNRFPKVWYLHDESHKPIDTSLKRHSAIQHPHKGATENGRIVSSHNQDIRHSPHRRTKETVGENL